MYSHIKTCKCVKSVPDRIESASTLGKLFLSFFNSPKKIFSPSINFSTVHVSSSCTNPSEWTFTIYFESLENVARMKES